MTGITSESSESLLLTEKGDRAGFLRTNAVSAWGSRTAVDEEIT